MHTPSTLANRGDAQPSESSLSVTLRGKVDLMIAQPPELSDDSEMGYEWARHKVDSFFYHLKSRLSVLAPGGVILFQPGAYVFDDDLISLVGYFASDAVNAGLDVVGVLNWHGEISDRYTDEDNVALLVLRRTCDARMTLPVSHLKPMSQVQLEMGPRAEWHFEDQDFDADDLCVPPLPVALFEEFLYNTSDNAVVLDLWGTYQDELLYCDTGDRTVISRLLDAEMFSDTSRPKAHKLIEAEHECVQLVRVQSRYFGKESREWQKLDQLEL